AEVGGHGLGRSSRIADRLHRRRDASREDVIPLLDRPCGDEHVGAVSREPFGDLFTDATTRARDQRGEPFHLPYCEAPSASARIRAIEIPVTGRLGVPLVLTHWKNDEAADHALSAFLIAVEEVESERFPVG